LFLPLARRSSIDSCRSGSSSPAASGFAGVFVHLVMAVCSVIDGSQPSYYWIAIQLLPENKRRSIWLYAGIALNILAIVLFKYNSFYLPRLPNC
jgi:hypothetical protein